MLFVNCACQNKDKALILALMIRLFWLLPLAGLVSLTSCDRAHERKSTAAGLATNQQTFQVKGVIKDLKPDGKTVEIRHEEVPNYMPAMTMPFEAKEPKELTGLKAGDAVSFRMTVTETEVWIDQIRKLTPPRPNELPSRSTFRFVRDVEPLQIGDPLPEYHFTNELGQAVSTSQFKGQALAITFIFTRCPLPNYCPLMSRNFSMLQKELRQQFPEKVHLLSISFDPAHDTTAVLKEYAENYGANPKDWSFATGTPAQIKSVATLFGLTYEMQGVSIAHNLRTALIDPNGRLVHVWKSNTWQPREVADMIQGIQLVTVGG